MIYITRVKKIIAHDPGGGGGEKTRKVALLVRSIPGNGDASNAFKYLTAHYNGSGSGNMTQNTYFSL